MDVVEQIPPERRYYTQDIPNNIIIVVYNIMRDIQYYKQSSKFKFKFKFNRRI